MLNKDKIPDLRLGIDANASGGFHRDVALPAVVKVAQITSKI